MPTSRWPAPALAPVLLLFLLLPLWAAAQAEEPEVQDTLATEVPAAPASFGNEDAVLLGLPLQMQDTFAWDVHQFDPAQRNVPLFQHIDNHASPAFPLFPQATVRPGFYTGLRQFDLYRVTTDNQPFWNTQNPYTFMQYNQGANILQRFSAIHTRNITPYWNASLGYRRFIANGFLDSNRQSQTNVWLNTWYRSPSGRYSAAASAIWNTFRSQQTGGLLTDTFFRGGFEQLAGPQRYLASETQLPAARQFFRDRSFRFRQYVYFGPKMSIDTLQDTLQIVRPFAFVSHQVGYNTVRYQYSDIPRFDTLGNVVFYPGIFYDRTQIFDEILVEEFTNRIGFGYLNPGRLAGGTFTAEPFAGYDLITYTQRNWQQHTYNATAGINLHYVRTFDVSLKGEYFAAGYNEGDALATVNVQPAPGARASMPVLDVSYQRRRAPWLYERLDMGTLYWRNEFAKQNTLAASAGWLFDSLLFHYLRIEAGGAFFNNYIFLDTAGRAAQADDDGQYAFAQVHIRQRVAFLHADVVVRGQRVLNGHYLRFPALVSRGSLWAQFRPFRNAPLHVRIGVDGRYFSSYEAYNYLPQLGELTLQRGPAGNTVGGYWVADAWASIRVKTFSAYAKIEHANQGMPDWYRMNWPMYPAYPRNLIFGVRWEFFN